METVLVWQLLFSGLDSNPTYEVWKRRYLSTNLYQPSQLQSYLWGMETNFKTNHVNSAPKNSNPTYEVWKLGSRKPDMWLSSHSNPTYEVWKLRMGFRIVVLVPPNSNPTYEVWKPAAAAAPAM